VYHTDYYTDFGKLNEISVVISPGPSYLESSATLYGDAYLSYGSLVLDGTGDYAVIDDGFRFTDSMTTSVWFKTTATGDRRIYSSHVRQMGGADYRNGFFARLNNGQLKYRHPAGGTGELTGPSGLNDGAWHHLALSWEARVGYVLYVDGVQRGQGSSGASDGYAAGWGLYIGANPWNNKDPYALFDGEIKNFEVLNEVLTSQQVTDRFNDNGMIEMVCYDTCMDFPYHRLFVGNPQRVEIPKPIDHRCGISTQVKWHSSPQWSSTEKWVSDDYPNSIRNQCKRACSACDTFFEENLDQWLGDGSSEENCFEWNIQVSRHDLLPTSLSLSRARARSLSYACGCALASPDTQFTTRPCTHHRHPFLLHLFVFFFIIIIIIFFSSSSSVAVPQLPFTIQPERPGHRQR